LVRGGADMVGGAVALTAVAASGGAAAPLAGAIKSATSGALKLGAHVIDTRSLENMLGDLREHLKGIEAKLLVVVDDLDRLQPDEVRQVLTLVKTFGNLPNVIHLLVYDRNILDAALGPSGAPVNGSAVNSDGTWDVVGTIRGEAAPIDELKSRNYLGLPLI
jgi:hypothetical protein